MRLLLKAHCGLLALVTCFACNDPGNSSTHSPDKIMDSVNERNSSLLVFQTGTQINLQAMSIVVPKGWRPANDDTMPKPRNSTTSSRFHNINGKIVYLEYGLSTMYHNPAEPNVFPASFRKGFIKNNADTSDVMFTDDPRLPEIRKKSPYLFSHKNISSFSATFFRPKVLGKGYTGVYVDSIGEIAGNIAVLVMYAEDLDQAESRELQSMLRTLSIKGIK